MVNRSTEVNPFIAAYGHQPKQAIDISDVPCGQPAVSIMIDRNKEIYRKVEEALAKANNKYKLHSDKKKRHQEFLVGELVMVHISKERTPAGTYSKLQARNHGPFKILKKINDNAYVIDLPDNYNMSKSFNVCDIRKYYPAQQSDHQLGTIDLIEGVNDAVQAQGSNWLDQGQANSDSF